MSCYNRPPLREVEGILVFSEPDAYIENYDKISGDHVSAITKESENPWIAAELWEEMEIGTAEHVFKCLEASSGSVKILDVGVGLGRLLDRIKSSHFSNLDLYGVDIALPYLKIAHSKGLNVALAKIEDMPYVDEYFDIITCTDVLEHVEDLNYCIKKIISCLKPGGTLVVRVPNREDLSPYLKSDYPYNLAHIRNFDEFSLELLLTKIFNLKFVTKTPGLLIENPPLLKCKIPFRAYNLLLKIFLRTVGMLNYKSYERMLAKFYHPTEINIVLKKPSV